MKKIFFISGVIMVAMTACTVEESLTQVEKTGISVNFRGETYPSTKISIGEQNADSTWPVLWSATDQIGIISRLETTFMNAIANIHSDDAGSSSATFSLDSQVSDIPSQDIVVYYPYSSNTSYFNGSLNSYVSMEQSQARPGDTSHLGEYTTAYDTVYIDADGLDEGETATFDFALTHAVAYVRFVVSSSEFASYSLSGVSLYCRDVAIAGDMAISIEDGSVSTETARPYCVITVEEPETLSSAQEIWMVTIPVDLTGKDVYASVCMTDGEKYVTIPRKLNLGELKANAVNTITLDGISTADAADYPWYQTEETRSLAEGWAYGAANTYLVTNEDNETVSFEVKARGYFIGCREPKYARLSFTCNVGAHLACLSVNGMCSAAEDGSLDPNDYNKTQYAEIGSDYTLKVDINTPVRTDYYGFFGKVVICDEDKTDLWAFTVWYCPDGVEEQQYQNGVVMSKSIGNGYAADNTTWHSVGAYYQWGRPFPFSWSENTIGSYEATRVTDLSVSCENPDVFFRTNDAVNHEGDWYLGNHTGLRSDRKDNLWGNPNTSAMNGSSEKGTKTIFDPCPKGWMVISPTIVDEIYNGKNSEFETIGNVQYVTYNLSDGETAYFPFHSLRWGDNGYKSSNNLNDVFGLWTNSPWGTSDHYGRSLYYREANGWRTSSTRAVAYNIRCMKDDDNR